MGEEGSNTLTKEVSMLLLLHCHKGCWMAQYLFHQVLWPRTNKLFHFVLLLLVKQSPLPAAETEDEIVEECVEEGLENYAKEHTKKVCLL